MAFIWAVFFVIVAFYIPVVSAIQGLLKVSHLNSTKASLSSKRSTSQHTLRADMPVKALASGKQLSFSL